MGKQRRGRGIKKTPNWRGTCRLCGRTGVKLLWEKVIGTEKVKCCKICANQR
ncbi:MAG: hypothetical protein Q8930_06470 [Bacillota bacterium]|nr:hypothetical protein [Bacillota bacterium]